MKNRFIIAFLGILLGCLSLEASSGTKKINWDFVRPALGAGYVASTYVYGWMHNMHKKSSAVSAPDMVSTNPVISVSPTSPVVKTIAVSAVDTVPTVPVVEPLSVCDGKDGAFAAKVVAGLMCSVNIGCLGTYVTKVIVKNKLSRGMAPFNADDVMPLGAQANRGGVVPTPSAAEPGLADVAQAVNARLEAVLAES